MTRYRVNRIFARFEELRPNPTTELRYRSHFQLLIAVILSAQSTDKMVNKVTRELFAVAPTAPKMAALGVERIARKIARLGLYRNKAASVHHTSLMLVERHKGAVPKTREELICLPGVGRKTANVILNTLWGHREIAVDTHIFRVSKRIGLANASTVLATEQALKKVVPRRYQLNAHHWLILHGRYVCKARAPMCGDCPIRQWCEFPDKAL